FEHDGPAWWGRDESEGSSLSGRGSIAPRPCIRWVRSLSLRPRQPITSEQFERLMADNGVLCSMSRSGNVWDSAAMESFFSSLRTEQAGSKTPRTRHEARADVFDYLSRLIACILVG